MSHVGATWKQPGMAGWVRNRRDRSVEAVISGDPALVDDMLTRARQARRQPASATSPSSPRTTKVRRLPDSVLAALDARLKAGHDVAHARRVGPNAVSKHRLGAASTSPVVAATQRSARLVTPCPLTPHGTMPETLAFSRASWKPRVFLPRCGHRPTCVEPTNEHRRSRSHRPC
jgi:acylphosphatase